MQKIISLLSILLPLLLVNCDNTQSSEANHNLEELLTDLVVSDGDLSLDALSDEEVANELFIDGDADELGRYELVENYEFPIKWGRFIQSIEGNIVFDPYDLETDTLYASIERVIIGNLVVVSGDTSTTDSGFVFTPIDTTSKPFEMFSTRRVRFVRMFGNEDPFHGWRIRGKTPVVINSVASTVGISSISLNRQTAVFEFEPIFSYSPSDSTVDPFLTIQNIPRLFNHEFIKALALIDNTNPNMGEYPGSGEGVFLHYGRFHHFKGRHPMFDDGGIISYNGHYSFDETENDNEFTRIFKVRRSQNSQNGIAYKMYFDTIDYETLLNPEGEYHSTIIGIPYIIQN